MKRWIKVVIFLFLTVQLVYGQSKKRVACIGDSVTKGYNLKKGQSYPEQLQSLLGSGFEVGNFGRNGATVLEKGHNPYLKSEELQAALAFNPDIIVVSLGLNDTDPRNWPNYKNDFIHDYIKLINLFKSRNRNVKVYICEMTPIFSGHPRFLSGTREWYKQVQSKIGEMAVRNMFTLVDNYSPLKHRIDLFEDYLHPSAEGARIIAEAVWHQMVPIRQPLSIHESLGSHMVLQRGKDNIIKGRANAGETIIVEFEGGKSISTTNSWGGWAMILNREEAGGPFQIKISTETDSIILEDVMFGDVYLASGQSNMAFPLRSAKGSDSLISGAEGKNNLRIFKNKALAETNNVSWDPETLDKINKLEYFSGGWERVNSANVADFSAIAYSFAENLQHESGVPIGIVELAVGGSNTESWIPRRSLEDDELLAGYIHSWRTSDFIQAFCRERAAVNLKHSTIMHQRHPYDPAYNYESGLRKWIDFPFKAVLWYQGESNAHNIELHEHLFKTLVSSWRQHFQWRSSGRPDLPFYVVQLSSINRPSWGYFRDSQRRLSADLPYVYMAVSSDLGDSLDVHPKDKIPIGLRLANLVREHEFGHDINADTPQPIRSYHVGDDYVIEFSDCKHLKTSDLQEVRGFQGMDEEGNLVDLRVKEINGNKVVLINPRGLTEIYYGYKSYTDSNLVNEENVPVSSFSIKR